MNGHNLSYYRQLRIIAYGYYRNDLFRLAKQLTIVVIGILAMIIPNTHHTGNYNPEAVVVTLGLFTIALLLAIASMLDRRQREVLEDTEKGND